MHGYAGHRGESREGACARLIMGEKYYEYPEISSGPETAFFEVLIGDLRAYNIA
jgi:hypothetical protein